MQYIVTLVHNGGLPKCICGSLVRTWSLFNKLECRQGLIYITLMTLKIRSNSPNFNHLINIFSIACVSVLSLGLEDIVQKYKI